MLVVHQSLLLDGYVVRGPLMSPIPCPALKVTWATAAGVLPSIPVEPGEAVRIMTEAPLLLGT